MNLKSNLTDLRDRQVALEQEGIDMGVANYNRARERGEESESMPGARLLRKAVEPTAFLIEKFIEDAGSGKAGRKHAALPYIVKLDPEQAALITAKQAINGAAGQKQLQNVALSVAGSIQDHLNIAELAKKSPGLYRKVAEQLKTSTSERHRSAVYNRVIAKYSEQPVSWNESEKVLLGTKLLELLIEATDMVKLVRITGAARYTPIEVHFGDEWLPVLERAHEQCALLSPVHLPMVHPPREWKHPYSGGYLTDLLKPRLVRTRSREYMDELGSTDLARVLDAVNAVQATPWRINKAVLEVMTHLWDTQSACGSLPQRFDDPLPVRPVGIAADIAAKDLPLEKQEELKEWKARAAKVYEGNAKMRSVRGQFAQKLYVANRFKDDEAIYFPHYLDFRGRVYPFANYLNPQGDDVSKGLIQFAEGKPLGETGAYWLAVHIANLFGVDKVAFDDRVQWVMDNEAAILDSAVDPLDGERFWMTADKGDNAFCALAACFEWAGYRVSGDAYVSHLPVAMDGSCSGLQHFSALLRDEVGGAAVNLVPSEKPADVYTAVFRKAQDISDKRTGEFVEEFRGKFCRAISKQPTMTLCYSATKRGMQKQIESALKKLGTPDAPYLGADVDTYHASSYAADVVWEALEETVVAARGAMDWLQSVSKLISKAGLPIRWTTPMGLPVMQAYREEIGDRVKVFVGGKEVQMMLSVETDRIDSRRQASGIAPNFVHSLDSSHLMRTATLAKANGITSIAVIHDSFGTHACDTDMLHAVIREAFVQQYEEDLLAKFRDQVVAQLLATAPELVEEMPPLPPKGNLELTAVRDSDFLFA